MGLSRCPDTFWCCPITDFGSYYYIHIHFGPVIIEFCVYHRPKMCTTGPKVSKWATKCVWVCIGLRADKEKKKPAIYFLYFDLCLFNIFPYLLFFSFLFFSFFTHTTPENKMGKRIAHKGVP